MTPESAPPAAEFRNGQSWFRLTIAGYQFDWASNYHDANWLRIHGDCAIDGRQWSFTDPCLETDDVARLADWLDALAAGNYAKRFCGFIEPNLDFILTDDNAICITFAAESTPPWTTFHSPEEQRQIVLPVSPALTDIANALRGQLSVYPQRGTR